MKSLNKDNNRRFEYLQAFGMLRRKLHPVVHGVVFVNRGEESELVEETTNSCHLQMVQ